MSDYAETKERVLSIVPDMPISPALALMKTLLGMDDVIVAWRYAAKGELPDGKDGEIMPLLHGPNRADIIVRQGIDPRWAIWVMGHELIHHCQRFRLWPPEEDFVEHLDMLLIYALRGILSMREAPDA